MKTDRKNQSMETKNEIDWSKETKYDKIAWRIFIIAICCFGWYEWSTDASFDPVSHNTQETYETN